MWEAFGNQCQGITSRAEKRLWKALTDIALTNVLIQALSDIKIMLMESFDDPQTYTTWFTAASWESGSSKTLRAPLLCMPNHHTPQATHNKEEEDEGAVEASACFATNPYLLVTFGSHLPAIAHFFIFTTKPYSTFNFTPPSATKPHILPTLAYALPTLAYALPTLAYALPTLAYALPTLVYTLPTLAYALSTLALLAIPAYALPS
ncbi:hypothetical protein L208DRAFT_1376795 [Tricholoma matsutake]|nr:hypothetical protein L208DRAFT_1376795 [Tricholoma matsutake 945]